MSNQEQAVVGGRELDQLLQTLPVKMEKNILRAAMRAGAAAVLPDVRARIPVDHGDLRKSARVTTRAARGSVSASVKVGNRKVYYAGMVEFGTRPHVIKVDDRDRGINRRTGRQISVTTVNRHLRLGVTLIGPSVSHPGGRPHPFLRPAADAGLAVIVQASTAKIRERLNAQGLNAPAPLPAEPAE